MSLCFNVLGDQELEATQTSMNICGALNLAATAEVRSQADVVQGEDREASARVSKHPAHHPFLSIVFTSEPTGTDVVGTCDKTGHRFFPASSLHSPSPSCLSRHLGSQFCFQVALGQLFLSPSKPDSGLRQMLTSWQGHDLSLLVYFEISSREILK